MKRNQKYGLGIHLKLFLVFLGIMIPIFTFITFNYFTLSSSLYQQAKDSYRIRCDTVWEKMDYELWKIYTNQLELYENQNLMMLSTMPETLSVYKKAQEVDAVMDTLAGLVEQYQYAKKSTLYIPKLNRVFTSSQEVMPLEAADVDLDRLKSDYFTSCQIITRNYHFVTLYPAGEQSDISFAIVTELSEENLRDDLMQLAMGNGEAAILTDQEGGWYVSTLEDPVATKAVLQQVSEKNEAEAGNQEFIVEADGKRMACTSRAMFGSNFRLVTLMPDSSYQNAGSLKQFVILVIAMFLLFLLTFYFLVRRMIYRPMNKLVQAFSQVKDGNLNARIDYKGRDEFSYLYDGFDSMIEQLESLFTENYEQNLLMQRAELKLLQAQIDPHFLYNSFLNIYSMAQLEDYEGIQGFTQKLSAYYRYITRNQSGRVKMIQEYEFTQNYLDIQSVRFGGRVRVLMDPIPPEYAEKPAPKLFLQPLVENAFKHGFSKTVKNGNLQIRFYPKGDQLVIRVENSGEPVTEEMLEEYNARLNQDVFQPVGEITGIVNVNKRLSLFYGSHSGLKMKSSALGGMCVEITIHFEEEYHVPDSAGR